MEVDIRQVKRQLSRILQRIELGEVITISKPGVPVARVVPAVQRKGKRPLGLFVGKIWIAEDFDASLTLDEL